MLLLSSYLNDRYIYVNDRKGDSNLCKIHIGVPQGSVLGGLLFSIFINDLCKQHIIGDIFLYADYTSIVYKADSVHNLENMMNVDLSTIDKWISRNLLLINYQKTCYMLFKYGTSNFELNITSQNNVIKRVNNVKVLGLIFDESLNFKNHIEHLIPKINRGIGLLKRLSSCLGKNELTLMFNAFVLPYYTYCIECWGFTINKLTSPLEKLHKKAIRIIFGKSFIHHTKPLYEASNILPFYDLVRFCASKYIHQSLLHGARNIFTFVSHIITTRQISNSNLVLPKFRLEVLKRSLFYEGVKMYNSVPRDFKKLSMINFKRAMRGT